jgi:hypothetical protein
MQTFIIFLISLVASLTVYAKPKCQGFNNYDNKVTIVFTDDKAAGNRYTVSDVKLIPSWGGVEYSAISIKTNVKDGVATVTLIFPHITRFSNPKVPVVVLCDMLRCQILSIQRTKDKNITDSFKALYIKLLIDDSVELLFRQEITVALCLVKTDF